MNETKLKILSEIKPLLMKDEALKEILKKIGTLCFSFFEDIESRRGSASQGNIHGWSDDHESLLSLCNKPAKSTVTR